MRRVVLALLLLLLAPAGAWASGTPSGGASISYVEPADGQVRIIVSLPPTADPDLDSVDVTIGGVSVSATAESAGTSGASSRKQSR